MPCASRTIRNGKDGCLLLRVRVKNGEIESCGTHVRIDNTYILAYAIGCDDDTCFRRLTPDEIPCERVNTRIAIRDEDNPLPSYPWENTDEGLIWLLRMDMLSEEGECEDAWFRQSLHARGPIMNDDC